MKKIVNIAICILSILTLVGCSTVEVDSNLSVGSIISGGSTSVKCHFCNGTGEYVGKCNRCDGIGEVPCDYCAGKGEITCRHCNGSAVEKMENDD